MESTFLAASDVVLYVSNELMAAEAGRQLNEHTSSIMAWVRTFVRRAAADEPADLSAIPRPRIGFFGGFDDYTVIGVDREACRGTTRHPPGAYRRCDMLNDAPATAPECALARLPPLPRNSGLRIRLRCGANALAAQRVDHVLQSDQAEGVLALGLPVVSADFPEVHRYKEWIGVAQDHDDFIRQVNTYLKGPSPVTGPAARSPSLVRPGRSRY